MNPNVDSEQPELEETPQPITCSGSVRLNFDAIFGDKPKQEEEMTDGE